MLGGLDGSSHSHVALSAWQGRWAPCAWIPGRPLSQPHWQKPHGLSNLALEVRQGLLPPQATEGNHHLCTSWGKAVPNPPDSKGGTQTPLPDFRTVVGSLPVALSFVKKQTNKQMTHTQKTPLLCLLYLRIAGCSVSKALSFVPISRSTDEQP